MREMARLGLDIMTRNGQINADTRITPDQARQAIKIGIDAEFKEVVRSTPKAPK